MTENVFTHIQEEIFKIIGPDEPESVRDGDESDHYDRDAQVRNTERRRIREGITKIFQEEDAHS